MVAKGPVNVNWQTVFGMIPILAIWATYRIQKTRIFLLIFWAGFGIAATIKDLAILGFEDFVDGASFEDPVYLGSFIGFAAIELTFRAYFVRKWSREWNEKIQIGN